jgi:hypothetical protein
MTEKESVPLRVMMEQKVAQVDCGKTHTLFLSGNFHVINHQNMGMFTQLVLIPLVNLVMEPETLNTHLKELISKVTRLEKSLLGIIQLPSLTVEIYTSGVLEYSANSSIQKELILEEKDVKMSR